MEKVSYRKLRTGYFPNGEKKYDIYSLGDQKLLSTSYYESGQTFAEIFWKFDEKDFNLDNLLSSWITGIISSYTLLKKYEIYIHGNVAFWYSNGQLFHENNFINGISDGAQIWYRENGNKDYEGFYKNGLKHGMFTVYLDNGKVDFETKVENGIDLWHKAYWRSNGKLMLEDEYFDGKLFKNTSWYESGQIEDKANFIALEGSEEGDESFDGECTFWYENGQIKYLLNYKNGVQSGQQKSWDENGNVLFDDYYVEGEQYWKDKKIGNVYLMKNARNGYTKIGFTKNKPTFRERTLQSEEPEIELFKYWKGSMHDEEKLHNIFKDKRIRGEWFDLNETHIKQIEKYFND